MIGVPQLSGLPDRLRLRTLRATAPDVDVPVIPAGAALARLELRAASRPTVTLVVPTVRPAALFAGLSTGIEVAGLVAERCGLPLRVLTLDVPSSRPLRASRAALANRLGCSVEDVLVSSAWRAASSHPEDIWIATYYATAYAIDLACRRGAIRRERVISLVQDHEPDFFPASIERSVADLVLRSGFRHLVNSEPLRRYLVDRTAAQDVTRSRTFRPALDEPALRAAAELRTASPVVRLGFYARPGKPRNAFGLGRAAFVAAGRQLDDAGVPFEVTTVGEHHGAFEVAGRPVKVLGRLPWSDSFRALADIDVLLSLQLTPHPSHPPLDAVVSGGWAVTNDLDGTRQGLHTRLLAGPAEPDALGDLIVQAARRARGTAGAGFDGDFLAALGRPLEAAVDDVLIGLS